jgi:sulfur-oxidizing protein SoxZ
VVFSVDLHEAVAANPYVEFYLRATASGQLEFVWEEDGGGVYALAHHLMVT